MPAKKNKNLLDLHVVVFAGPNGSGKTSLIDEIKETGLETVKGVLTWVIKRLILPLQERERDLNELMDMLDKKGHMVGDTDELNGTYKDPVLFKTSHYLVQLDDATNQAVIHDRLMLDTAQKDIGNVQPAYEEDENLTIHYSQENAPRVERRGKV